MSGQAGAVAERDREIEITPEMVEAGLRSRYASRQMGGKESLWLFF